jgi:hypothetical protein
MEEVMKTAKTEDFFKNLIDSGLIKEELREGKTYYGMGNHSMKLVNTWKTEDISKGIYWLALILGSLALLQIALYLIK